jgi:hypothetical protein
MHRAIQSPCLFVRIFRWAGFGPRQAAGDVAMKRERGDATEHARALASRVPENGDGYDLFATPPRSSLPEFPEKTGSALTIPAEIPGWATRWDSLTEQQREAQRSRWKALLEPHVLELARKSGPEGIIASDVLSLGVTLGILNGERLFVKRHPRIYAFLGPWLGHLAEDGKLVPKMIRLPDGSLLHVKRKSTRLVSKGNQGAVYLSVDAS